MRVFAIWALVLAAGPGWAGTSSPSEVAEVSGGLYEVTPRKSRATSDFWCAIGTYAVRQLGKPVGQEIYVWRGRGPGAGGRSSVRFGFAPPPGGAVASASLSVDTVGNSLSVAQAQQTCFDRLVND